ncbi:hypothetical protein HPP92_014878 [Vanilla planifolia]|uniref:Peroxin/Ferlin domain-containing protein n=1 Tax=Vanilla planifolia TaxID=51239 RepID=A0A835UV96_VANPL|nr:hypothetical protein HPP92_014878 [Vanilla planifolia]
MARNLQLFQNLAHETLKDHNSVLIALVDRLVVKDKSLEMNGNVLGLKMESNGIRILEPFDTSMKFSNTFGRSNIRLTVSDIFLNLSFSILKLFLAVEDDILAFLRRTSKKVSVVCFQFEKVGAIQSNLRDQKYTFWRPRAPSGFAVLGDCLTPLNEPPAKGVLAVNTSFAKVKRPTSYRLISSFGLENAARKDFFSILPSEDDDSVNDCCSVWFPVAPKGYVAVGCVVSPGSRPPSLSSALCILSSLVTPCTLKDCIAFQMADLNGHANDIAFWRVDNSFGSFLPASSDMSVDGRAYEFRHMIFGLPEQPAMTTKVQNDSETSNQSPLQGRTVLTSGRLLEVVASFRLIWWNQGTDPHKRLSIWRPVVPRGMVFLGDIAVQGYEPPNLAIVLNDTVDEALFKCPQDFQLLGRIKKNKGNDGIYFWMPLAPPGYVAMGCVACKGPPKGDDLSCLRCIRSDMVTGDQFPDESLWDTSVGIASTDSFSLWSVGHEVGTFIVRKGFKKPPKRFALKLANPNVPSGSDGMVLDAELKNFSVAVFDDYEGLMVPLFNFSLGCIGLNFYGRSDYMNSTLNFSLASRSYNDKYDDWEPLIEPTDGFLRYQYDLNRPGAATQIRVTSTKDLTLNMSASNLNLMFQAYTSWCNLILVDESSKMRKYVNQEGALSKCDEASIIDIHRKKNYFIIPQNQLGQDIYIRATENDRLSSIIKMPSGDNRPIKVPVSKNLLNSHMDGKTNRISQSLLTVVISEAELPTIEAMASAQYSVAVRLFLRCSAESSVQQQSARTCGASPETSADVKFLVKWNEIFFFKVDFVDNYIMEFTIIDMGRRGEPIGIYSSSLEQIVSEACSISSSNNSCYDLTWTDLSSVKRKASFDDVHMHGRIRCAVLLSTPDAVKKDEKVHNYARAGVIQISPAREGPWTTVRLNYASPAACWRLGDDVVASEVTVRDGNRFVSIRSLVSVTNNTDFVIDLCLKSKNSPESMHFTDGNEDGNNGSDDSRIHVDEFFETEQYSPSDGWHSCSLSFVNGHHQEMPNTSLPDGWEWIDEWHVDDTSVEISDGWVYAPDTEHLKWPETYDHLNHINFARQRRWIRHKKYTVHDLNKEISVGLLEPGHTIPLPLCGLVHPVFSYFLKLRPKLVGEQKEYSWSSVLKKHELSGSGNFNHTEGSEICVSELTEADTLLYCPEKSDFSTDKGGLWFCLTIQEGRESATRSQGVLFPGKSAKIYNANVQGSLYLSILPQRGWELTHEPIPITHGSKISSMTMNLRNSYSGRLVVVIVDQTFNKDHSIARSIRIYVPYWIESARCPPLTFNFVDRKEKRSDSGHSKRNMKAEKILWQITNEDMTNGYTIVSALNFKYLALSVSLSNPGKEKFGPVKELSPLGDMDGSIDLYAYDADGNSMRIFIFSKTSPPRGCSYKVRPFMAFTNRLGEDLFIILNSEDQPKILHASDARVAFVCSKTGGQEKIQVRLWNTNWCLPFEIANEDTLTISLKMHHGVRKYLRAEIRGYEEGSRFLVVFRMEPARGPIRIENRMADRTLEICQSGLADDDWIKLEPLSSTNFSWDDPFGQRSIDVRIQGMVYVQNISLDEVNDSRDLKAHGINLHVEEAGDVKFVRFIDEKRRLQLESRKMIEPLEKASTSKLQEMQSGTSPLELIIELGIVGVSLIDHKPRELLYLYLEKVFASFSTGYDAGKTSRFKLIVGKLQLDNQLPLTIMPVLLAPEDMPDLNHPVFKATVTLSNDNIDGTQIFPYVYVRVTEKCWRINVHEPIIWALVDFYSNLRLYSTPSNLDVTQVDPEIRFDLIDVSEIRLKLSLETSPNQRPHGALGIWGPILSTVGNAFKLQLHLRKVMHKNRFMRRSSILPAIVNRIKRDLIHNPLHVIFSVDVLGMTKSTLASLSKGFAELSTDRQFLQLRSKQVWSRRITGFSDGFLQGTEAFAQGVAFGVTGVLRKPVENARQHGFLGLAHGLGRAFLGFVVQPLSGALDFVSLTVDGVGASFSKCLDILSNKATAQRIRYPRAIRANGIIEKYSEREAIGQMILYLAEASRHLRCADLFKEPSKYAWSDYYEDHFIVPFQRIVLITNKRVMLLQALSLDKLAKKPSKILWDVPWDELLALELAKAGHVKPSHLIIHLKHFKRSESFVRIVRCNVDEEEGQESQAVVICSCVRRMWKAHQADMKFLSLKVPSSQRYVQFADETGGRDSFKCRKPVIKSRGFQSASSHAEEMRFKKHCVNFQKIWSSEQEYRSRCTLFPKQVIDDSTICSIWRPLCPNGYVSVGDVAHIGIHQPHVAAVYKYSERSFSLPVGYDLVWRNCASEYSFPLSIWLPRPPDGFAALGCVAVAAFDEPPLDSAYCVSAELAENTEFEEQMMWAAPDSYPWACFIYQAQSEALQFVALRQPKEDSDWRPMRVSECEPPRVSEASTDPQMSM